MRMSDATLRAIDVHPLTPATFAPFGDVIGTEAGTRRLVNQGRAWRHDDLAHLSHETNAALPTLALYQVTPSHLPLQVDLFERHPWSSQVFVPMDGARYLVVVAPDTGGMPDAERAEAFQAEPDTAVHYRAGVWHMPIVALDRPALFAMLIFETGSNQDTVEARLSTPLLIRA